MDASKPDFGKQMIDGMRNALEQGTLNGIKMVWDFLLSFLREHWMLVILFLVLILAYAIFRAVDGRWGTLGSVLYHYLYFGILFLLGLTFSSSIFASPLVDIGLFALYIICYWLVGRILNKTGLKTR